MKGIENTGAVKNWSVHPVLYAFQILQDVKTPLDDYVARPDPNYKWTVLEQHNLEVCTLYVLNMTSQQWLTGSI